MWCHLHRLAKLGVWSASSRMEGEFILLKQLEQGVGGMVPRYAYY